MILNLAGTTLVLLAVQVAQAEMNWDVYEKVSSYGKTLTLYCKLDEICKQTAGWVKWISNRDFKTLIFSVKETSFNKNAKYDGRIGQMGFYLMIRNVSSDDFETNYSCTYSIDISPKKLLTKLDAFKEGTQVSSGKIKTDNEQRTVICILIILVIVLFVAVVLLSLKIVKRRCKNKFCGNTGTSNREDIPEQTSEDLEQTSLIKNETDVNYNKQSENGSVETMQTKPDSMFSSKSLNQAICPQGASISGTHLMQIQHLQNNDFALRENHSMQYTNPDDEASQNQQRSLRLSSDGYGYASRSQETQTSPRKQKRKTENLSMPYTTYDDETSLKQPYSMNLKGRVGCATSSKGPETSPQEELRQNGDLGSMKKERFGLQDIRSMQSTNHDDETSQKHPYSSNFATNPIIPTRCDTSSKGTQTSPQEELRQNDVFDPYHEEQSGRDNVDQLQEEPTLQKELKQVLMKAQHAQTDRNVDDKSSKSGVIDINTSSSSDKKLQSTNTECTEPSKIEDFYIYGNACVESERKTSSMSTVLSLQPKYDIDFRTTRVLKSSGERTKVGDVGSSKNSMP